MSIKKNACLIIITLFLYMVNQLIKTEISNEVIRYFCICYYNDTIGSITFIAYCNLVLKNCGKSLDKLYKIELTLFLAGIFWEYITPIFRSNTTTDILDIIAYMIGGYIYWIIYKIDCNYSNNDIQKKEDIL